MKKIINNLTFVFVLGVIFLVPLNISLANCTSAPRISYLSPSEIYVDEGSVDISIIGKYFTDDIEVTFDGYNRSITYLSSTKITIRLRSSDTDTADDYRIKVVNDCGSDSEVLSIIDDNENYYYSSSAITNNASAITDYAATLSGTINIYQDYCNYSYGYCTSSCSNCKNYYNYGNKNITAWFEYGTSSSLLNYNETDRSYYESTQYNKSFNVAQNASGLNPNTRYYFRLAMRDGDGNLKKGNILSFTTTNYTNYYNPPQNIDIPQITSNFTTTIQATNQTETSAKLRGLFINQDNILATAYFKYGATNLLGSTTNSTNLGTNYSTNFSADISGLIPGTTYYFQAIAVKQGKIYPGKILIFQTKGGNIPLDIEEKPAPIKEKPKNIPQTKVVKKPETKQGPSLSITNEKDKYLIGDEINYFITFENKTGENLENVKLMVNLPQEVSFKESNFGKIEDNNTVMLDVGILIPNQAGSMTIKGKINSNARAQEIFTTTAIMSYTTPGLDSEEEKITYVVNHTEFDSSLAASSILGINFLPSTLLGWLILIMILLIIMIVIRKTFF